MKEANKKKEEKIKELQEFISRFSANASKSKQATSRKRALEKIQLDDIQPSSRKYPYIDFRPNREIGNEVLTVDGLSKTIDGEKVLDNISFTLNREDKVAFVGGNEQAKNTLFQILMGEMEPDEGTYKWGVTTTQAYFPLDYGDEFDNDYTIVEWLTQYSEEKDATYVRGFLGRMLFSGDDGVKRVKVLSGGEKVRCPPLQDDDLRIQRASYERAHQPPGYGVHHSPQQRHDQVPGRDPLLPAGTIRSCRQRQTDHGDRAWRKAHRQDHNLRRIPGER